LKQEEPKVVIDVKKDDENDDDKPECIYGENCYRKNPQHFKDYRHPVVKNKPKLEEIAAKPVNLGSSSSISYPISSSQQINLHLHNQLLSLLTNIIILIMPMIPIMRMPTERYYLHQYQKHILSV
jgi:hypothetical protein